MQTPVVVELNVTARPDEAVALTVKSAAVTGLFDRAPKVIVWLALPTVKLCDTDGAALYVALPAWSALIVQVPVDTRWTVEPLTVQTPVVVELKVTVRPELAVALTAKSAAPYVLFERAPKVMV